jgi:acyl carrier protein
MSVFPDLTEDEISTSSIASVSAWDSLATVTLVAVIEEEFKIPVQSEDLELFISFDLILDLIISKTSA